MSDNFFEIELRKALELDFSSQRIKDLGSALPFFNLLMKTYPVDGSKIDWARVPGAAEQTVKDELFFKKQSSLFFEAIVLKYCLRGNV